MTHPDLKGKSVFITGGGSGIGAALTEGFIVAGAQVAFVDICDADGFCDDVARRTGVRPLFIHCDITDTEALQTAMDSAALAYGGLDVLVNNAAKDMRYDAADITPQIWDDMMAVNLKAYFFACQHAATLMKPGSSIINFSSISYMMGAAELMPYTAANAGITGMTRSLARAWGPDGLRVNAIAPGWVLTERQLRDWATPEATSAYLKRQCLPEHLMPHDIVGPVLFLASNASRMITGQCLVVDGGLAVTG